MFKEGFQNPRIHIRFSKGFERVLTVEESKQTRNLNVVSIVEYRWDLAGETACDDYTALFTFSVSSHGKLLVIEIDYTASFTFSVSSHSLVQSASN